MAANGLYYADVPLSNYSLTHSLYSAPVYFPATLHCAYQQTDGQAELTWVAEMIYKLADSYQVQY